MSLPYFCSLFNELFIHEPAYGLFDDIASTLFMLNNLFFQPFILIIFSVYILTFQLYQIQLSMSIRNT